MIEPMPKDRSESSALGPAMVDIAGAHASLLAEALTRYSRLRNDDALRSVAPSLASADARRDATAVTRDLAELWTSWERSPDLVTRVSQLWYCSSCQQPYRDDEVLDGPSCPSHVTSVERFDGECYFFRLPAHGTRLLEYYDQVEARTGRPFVLPASRMRAIRALAAGDLRDVPLAAVPHRWSAASGDRHFVHAPLRAAAMCSADSSGAVHIVTEQHAVLHAVHWAAMALAAGRQPPGRVLVVGSSILRSGASPRRRTLSPDRVAADLGADAVRYLVLRAAGQWANGLELVDRYNRILARGLGTLVTRVTAVAAKFEHDGIIARPPETQSLFQTPPVLATHLDDLDLPHALEAIESLITAGNEFVARREPWRQTAPERAVTLWHAFELCRVLSHLLSPVLPEACRRIQNDIGIDEPPHWPLSGGHRGPFRARPAEPLFPLIDATAAQRLVAGWTSEAIAVPVDEIVTEDFSRLDLRVARIAAVTPIAGDDQRLFAVALDLGADQRTVVMSRWTLARYEPRDLVDKLVVYLANLPAVQIAGIWSKGMILKAMDPSGAFVLAFDREHEPGTVMF